MEEKKTRRQQFYEGVSAVVRNPSLTIGEKSLWTLYRTYDNKGNGAWISDRTAADHLNRSPRAIQQYRKGLMEKGFLKQQLRGPEVAKHWAIIPEGFHLREDDGNTPKREKFDGTVWAKPIAEILQDADSPLTGAQIVARAAKQGLLTPAQEYKGGRIGVYLSQLYRNNFRLLGQFLLKRRVNEENGHWEYWMEL
jgi:hypothetical protein